VHASPPRRGATPGKPPHPHLRPPQNVMEDLSKRAAAAGAAAMLALGGLSGAAVASEFDILAETTAPKQHYFDDANVLSKQSRADINKKLNLMEVGGPASPGGGQGLWGGRRQVRRPGTPAGVRRRAS